MVVFYSPKYDEIVIAEEVRTDHDLVRILTQLDSTVAKILDEGNPFMFVDDFIYLGFL